MAGVETIYEFLCSDKWVSEHSESLKENLFWS